MGIGSGVDDGMTNSGWRKEASAVGWAVAGGGPEDVRKLFSG